MSSPSRHTSPSQSLLCVTPLREVPPSMLCPLGAGALSFPDAAEATRSRRERKEAITPRSDSTVHRRNQSTADSPSPRRVGGPFPAREGGREKEGQPDRVPFSPGRSREEERGPTRSSAEEAIHRTSSSWRREGDPSHPGVGSYWKQPLVSSTPPHRTGSTSRYQNEAKDRVPSIVSSLPLSQRRNNDLHDKRENTREEPQRVEERLHGMAGTSPRGGRVDSAQYRLLERQCEHTLEELQRTRSAYEAAVRSAQDLNQAFNTQRSEHNTLLERYAALSDKVRSTERALTSMEETLAQERQRTQQRQAESDNEHQKAMTLRVECETLRRRLEEHQTAAGSSRQERASLQQLLQDRTKYVPAMEVRRMKEEWHTQQKLCITQPLQQLLQALSLSADAAQTRAVIGRSNVLSVARELEEQLAHTEATVAALREYVATYHQQLEGETTAFLERVVAENASLYDQLAALQQRYSVSQAELRQRLPRSEAVPVQLHEEELEHQAELYAGRLHKAQELLKAQTQLIRQHEESMAAQLGELEELEERHRTAVEETAAEAQRRQTAEQHTQQRVAALEAALAEEQRRREVEYVPHQEKDLLVQYVGELEDTVGEQRRAGESMKRELEAAQQLLKETSEAAEALEAELTAQQAQQAAHQSRWSTDLESQERSHQQAVAQLQGAYTAQLSQLEAALRREEAAAQRWEAQLGDAAVERSGLESRVALLQESLEERTRALQTLQEREMGPLRSAYEALQAQQAATQRLLLEAEGRCAALEADAVAAQRGAVQTLEATRAELAMAKREWEAAEAARVALQQALGVAQSRVEELERERGGDRVSGKDRATLLQENERLQAALQAQTEAAAEWHNATEQQRSHSHVQEALRAQLEELRDQLACLPNLQEAVRAMETETRAAKAEVADLLKERDALAAHIKQLLQRRAAASKVDEELDRVLHDAGEVTKRLTAAPPSGEATPRGSGAAVVGRAPTGGGYAGVKRGSAATGGYAYAGQRAGAFTPRSSAAAWEGGSQSTETRTAAAPSEDPSRRALVSVTTPPVPLLPTHRPHERTTSLTPLAPGALGTPGQGSPPPSAAVVSEGAGGQDGAAVAVKEPTRQLLADRDAEEEGMERSPEKTLLVLRSSTNVNLSSSKRQWKG